MRSYFIILIVGLFMATSSFAIDFRAAPGAGSVVVNISRNQNVYAQFTAAATASAYLTTSQCNKVSLKLTCNIANTSDDDCTALAYACPVGVTTATAACSDPIPYKDADNALQTVLVSTAGRDSIFGIEAQNLVISVTAPGSQTTQVEARCR